VGHEIDFTLCDFAADVRAETPSAAAELISSHFVRAAERAEAAAQAMRAALGGAIDRARERLAHGRSRLRLLTPAAQVERGFLRLDDLANRLAGAVRGSVQLSRQALTAAAARFERASPQARIGRESHRLLSLWKRLQSVSPASVLHRGFVIVRDAEGSPVTRRAALRPGQRLAAEFADGAAPLRVESPEPSPGGCGGATQGD
jgi:exodeoxyribonuclease VII large subunit